MDIPFPETTPRFIDSKWFSADNPCDEDAELTALEQSNQHWLSSVGQQYKARAPLGKTDPEPMEECESEEEEDSVQIVEDSDTVEEEPPNMNNDVELLHIREDSSHEDDAANIYSDEITPKLDDDSDDTDLESANSPPPTEVWDDDHRNVCTCGDADRRECNYQQHYSNFPTYEVQSRLHGKFAGFFNSKEKCEIVILLFVLLMLCLAFAIKSCFSLHAILLVTIPNFCSIVHWYYKLE